MFYRNLLIFQTSIRENLDKVEGPDLLYDCNGNLDPVALEKIKRQQQYNYQNQFNSNVFNSNFRK